MSKQTSISLLSMSLLITYAMTIAGCCARVPNDPLAAETKPPKLETHLWVVEQRELWGDYGDVLISGYATRAAADLPISLQRTGPFLPPISFPWRTDASGWEVVLSDALRLKLVSLNLQGVTFREAIKARIVPLAWEAWDLRSPGPALNPEEGEPENYIWNEKNDQKTAALMPRAFELCAPICPVPLTRVKDAQGSFLKEFTSAVSVTNPPPISRDHDATGYLIVDDSMRDWLEGNTGDWVRFDPVRTVK